MLANVIAFHELFTQFSLRTRLANLARLPPSPTPIPFLQLQHPLFNKTSPPSPMHTDPVILLDDNANSIMSERLSWQTPASAPSTPISPSVSATPSTLPDELSLPPQLTSDEEDKALGFFNRSILSQRNKDTTSWIWKYGLDIQDQGTRRWVCKVCVKKNPRGKPTNYNDKNLNNAKRHIINDHHLTDPTGKLTSRGIKRKYPSITGHFGLDTTNAADRSFANKLIWNFDRDRFQQLVMNWISMPTYPSAPLKTVLFA